MKSLNPLKAIGACLLLFAASCINTSIGVFQYSTTITVTDMDGKPLAGQKVKLVYGFGFSTLNPQQPHTKDSAFTDNTGKATFNYSLTTSESHSDNALFGTEKDSTWENIETLSHGIFSSDESLNKRSFTLRKDSLVPLSVQIKKTSNRVGGIACGFYSERKWVSNDISTASIESRSLWSWRKESVALFDTTLTVKVYSKLLCTAATDTLLKQGANIFWMRNKTIEFSPSDYKNKILTIQFE